MRQNITLANSGTQLIHKDAIKLRRPTEKN